MTLSRSLSHIVALSLVLLALSDKYHPMFLVYGMNKAFAVLIVLFFLAFGVWSGVLKLAHFDRNILLLFGLCALLSAISIPFQPASPDDLLVGLVNFVFRTLVMYLAVSIAIKALPDLQLPCRYFIAAGAFFAIGSVLVFILQSLLPELTAGMIVYITTYEVAVPSISGSFLYLVGHSAYPGVRVANYFTEAAKFAQFMILPLALVTLPNYRRKLTYRILFFFMLAALLASQALAVWVALIIALVATEYQRKGKLGWLGGAGISALGLLLVGLYLVATPENLEYFKSLNKSVSAAARLLDVISALNWASEYPMGVGLVKPSEFGDFENFDGPSLQLATLDLEEFSSYKGMTASSVWLMEVLVRGGWLYALLFVLISVKIVQLSLSLLKAKDPLVARLGFSVLALFLATLFYGPLEHKLMLIVLALAVAASGKRRVSIDERLVHPTKIAAGRTNIVNSAS